MFTYRLEGKSSVDGPPAECCTTSFQNNLRAKVNEAVLLKNEWGGTVVLSADAPFSIAFNGMVSVAVLSLRVKTVGAGKILAAFTHADGTAQVIPLDPLLLLISQSSPVTAITLTRTPSVAASIEVFLGEAAT